jgi:hypothetical protein
VMDCRSVNIEPASAKQTAERDPGEVGGSGGPRPIAL